MRAHGVRALLMGGQACVFYGAAEFSRDVDLAIFADAGNLARLKKALAELQAECIAVPPFDLKWLRRGHVIHFRCHHLEALQMRVDVMSRMRGVHSFARLWQRRTIIEMPGGEPCDLLSLPDLVQAKKTQRDKDWPMIRRLVEASYFHHQESRDATRVRFWLAELRSAELLIEVARKHLAIARKRVRQRPLLRLALAGRKSQLESALQAEERAERHRDQLYWRPLKKELEALRHELGKNKPSGAPAGEPDGGY